MDREEYVERVLVMVERIPPGRVMSYGDIAEAVGVGGPRQVGRVMSLEGGAVPWWRVVRADGGLPLCHDGRALEQHRAEGTPLRSPERVDMTLARWWPEGETAADLQAAAGPDGGSGSVGGL